MAMRTASPWWASLLFGFGLVCILVGERFFGHLGAVRILFTGLLGLVLVGGVTALRAWTMLASTGNRRKIERAFLICHAGTLVALLLYLFTTGWGLEALGIKSVDRWTGAITVIYAVLLLASVVPVILIEFALGSALRDRIDLQEGGDAGLDYYRVRDVGWSGLTLAFAASLLFVTCNVARERNVTRDVSYFKTSAPGESTLNIVGASTDPIHVHLFFPDTNEVKDQVLTYFDALKSTTGKITIESHDRLVDTALATKYKVGKEGVIVLARGADDKEKFYSIEIDTDIVKARRPSGGSGGKLRNLDREVNALLMKLVRDKRKAYLTIGHGELNSFETVPLEKKGGAIQERRITIMRRRLSELNYEVKDLTLMELATDIPDDATIVFMLAPSAPLQKQEWDTLERYLDRGGRLFVALDPEGEPSLGSLEGRLGVRLLPGRLTDDKVHARQTGTIADRRAVMTTQFSAHSSTTSLSRAGSGALMPLIESGALEEIPFTSKGEAPKKTITVRSMDSSWLDLGDNNFAFDKETEKRQRWNIGAAIEGPKVGGKDGFRALVYADVDLFRDFSGRDSLNRPAIGLVSGGLIDDSIRWLGGEELFAGEVISEDDKKIEHTKNQDALWFTITCLGVPLLVLGLGLFGTMNRRSGRKRKSNEEEVTP